MSLEFESLKAESEFDRYAEEWITKTDTQVQLI